MTRVHLHLGVGSEELLYTLVNPLIALLLLLLPITSLAEPTFLRGVIDTGKAETSVAVFGADKTILIRPGHTVSGFTLEEIRARSVVLSRKGELYEVRAGDAFGPEEPLVRQGIEHREGEIRVTTALRDYIAKDGLATVLMQAASEQVTENGEVVGYRLLDIDAGSVFDLAGIYNGDIVTEIDGVRADSPFVVIRMLMYIKERDDFTYAVRRGGSGGKTVTTRVVVR